MDRVAARVAEVLQVRDDTARDGTAAVRRPTARPATHSLLPRPSAWPVHQVGDSADASSSSSDSPPVLSVSVSIEAEPSLRALLTLLASLTKAGTDGHATALQLARRLDARGLANAVLAWAQLRYRAVDG